jgi:hypothetical protein
MQWNPYLQIYCKVVLSVAAGSFYLFFFSFLLWLSWYLCSCAVCLREKSQDFHKNLQSVI